MFGLFRNITPNDVWSKYRRLMTVGKLDQGTEDSNTEKEHEKTMFFPAKINDCITTVLECLVTDEKGGGTRQKNFVQTFQHFISV